jgi:surface polysaccharide O-acyltransferase-like enzyme
MIIGVYITIPILRQIAQNKTATKYFLIMAFVFTFILPLSLSITSKLLPSIISKSEGIVSLIYYYSEQLNLNLFAGYSGYFLLGHYLNINSFKRLKLIYLIGVVSFVLIVIGAITSYYIYGTLNNPLYGYLTPFVLFEAIAVFLFIKNHTPKIKFSAKAISLITKISNMCFGIYLVHILVLWLLSHYGISTNKFSTIISIPTISILVFAISLFISSCLYKIPFCRKYMM